MNSLKKHNKIAVMDDLIRAAKLRMLQMHFESGCGHIGGNLSCIDIVMTLFHTVLNEDDQFVLSKGHAAGALYTTLWSLGLLTDEDLRTFHKDGTRLGGHPSPHHMPQIPFATGSLGHGLPLACGIALGEQLRGGTGRVYCLLSDGEWQEGSNWEALIFAAARQLPLTLIVDNNGLQGFGTVSDISGADLVAQFRSFGLPVSGVSGHDPTALHETLTQQGCGLKAVVAETHKGNGIEFMQDRMEWHYLPMNESLYAEAVRTLQVRGRKELKAA